MAIFSASGLRPSAWTGESVAPVFDNPEIYYSETLSRPPHKVLSKALSLFSAAGIKSGSAIDLGCGSGRDTVELLRSGWSVHAVDSEASVLRYLQERVGSVVSGQLTFSLISLEEFPFLPSDLINAGLVLPFCRPENFPLVWERIINSLSPGGRFSGHLFGDRDTWAEHPLQSHHTRDALESMFDKFEIEHLEEVEDDDPAVDGEAKHWHIFHMVARKK